MRLRKKWLFVNLIIILLTLILYICYVQKNNSLYVTQMGIYGMNTEEKFLGTYDSKEDALKDNNIKIDKEWDFTNYSYILDIYQDDDGLYDLYLYKLDYDSGNVLLSNAQNNMVYTSGYHEIKNDREWYDTQICKDIMKIRTYFKSMIIGENGYPDIYYGLWEGDGIKQIRFSKGDFSYQRIDNNKGRESYLWTYELENSDELLGDIGEKKMQIDNYGDEIPSYEYKLRDVKKALGVTYDSALSVRVIVFLLLIVSSVIISITFTVLFLRKYGNTDILSRSIVILMGANGLLWAISELLILTYIFNPVLTFG